MPLSCELNHIFFKYRGREAVHKFLKEGTLFGDVISMFANLNADGFKGCLPMIVIILTIITLFLLMVKKIKIKNILSRIVLILPCLVYFFGISKASPYVSVRYVSPIVPLLFAAIAVWLKKLIDLLCVKKALNRFVCAIMCISLFLITFYSFQKPLKDSYFAERKEVIEGLVKKADYCMYITGDEYNWKMWEDYINYPDFKGLFFIDGRYTEPITDEKIENTVPLVIFVDKALDLDNMLEYLKKYLTVQQYEIAYETSYTYIIFAQ